MEIMNFLKIRNSVLKKCTMCNHKWYSRNDFLNDHNVIFVGYQVNFSNPEKGVFLFNHSCKRTMAIPISSFRDLYNGQIYDKALTGYEECPAYCLREDEFRVCNAKCKYAYIREIIQIIQNWEK